MPFWQELISEKKQGSQELAELLSLWAWWGSNPRPRDYESPALTTELQARMDLTLQNSN